MENRGNSHRSNNRSLSMSDTESQYQSPLRFDSPLRSDDPDPPPAKSPSKAMAAVDKFFSPIRSPINHHQNQKKKIPETNSNFFPPPGPEKSPTALVVYNQSVREDALSGVTKVGPTGKAEDLDDLEAIDGPSKLSSAMRDILRRSKRERMVKRVELGFRVCEVVLCLISFSVMAADKTQGWSGDSFDRYKEYRYCVAVTVIGFTYAAIQGCDLSYHLATGKHLFFHPLRCYFDFAMDQILAYLLISASSSAATRVDDWVSNWGKDEFTKMATASIGMSFLAFAAFSLTSLISGYNLCNRTTT